MEEKSNEKYSVKVLVLSFAFAGAGFALAIYMFFLLNGPNSFSVGFCNRDHLPISDLELFQKVPSLGILLMLIIAGVTFSFSMVYEALQLFKKINRTFDVPQKDLVWLFVVLMIIIVTLVFMPNALATAYVKGKPLAPPISYFQAKMIVVFIIYGVASATCISGLVIVGNIALNYSKRLPDAKSPVYYALLQQLQMRFLSLLGIQLTLGILTTAFMRHIHLDTYGPNQDYVTKEAVAVYGLFYTMIAALFFIPGRKLLQQFGYRIVDKKCGTGPKGDGTWKDWSEERDTIINLLNLKWSLKEISEWAIPVLAPLVTSILPEFMRG